MSRRKNHRRKPNIPAELKKEPEAQGIPAPSKETSSPNSEEKTMEVHHHAHVHSKSKWKEYIFQFFMLFLAVFCGFLAEYQLEHKIERDREIVYIKSMIEDLQKDTTNLAYCIDIYQFKGLQLDTLLSMYGKFSKGYNDTVHRNLQSIRGYPDFIYSDRTMEQLKYSGAMRLIRNQAALNGIVNYDWKIRDVVNVDIPSLDNQFSYNGKLMLDLIDEDGLEKDKKLKSIPELEQGNRNYLFTNDKVLLGQFNNMIRKLKSTYKIVSFKETELKKDATQLIALLKKEYHL